MKTSFARDKDLLKTCQGGIKISRGRGREREKSTAWVFKEKYYGKKRGKRASAMSVVSRGCCPFRSDCSKRASKLVKLKLPATLEDRKALEFPPIIKKRY